jgi:hypothetical protein
MDVEERENRKGRPSCPLSPDSLNVRINQTSGEAVCSGAPKPKKGFTRRPGL